MPYVFQVMSLLLEMHKDEIPNSYMALFPHLLQPVLWERTGNIPPLVRLLQAYLERGSNTIAASAGDKIVSGPLSDCMQRSPLIGHDKAEGPHPRGHIGAETGGAQPGQRQWVPSYADNTITCCVLQYMPL